MATRPMRPSGISVLSILAGLVGILALVLGIIVAVAVPFVTDLIESSPTPVPLPVGLTTAFLTSILAVAAAVVIIIGVLHILVAYGLWIGAGWGWWLTIILAILGAIFGLLSLLGGSPGGLIPLIIYGVIIWYLWQPHVKAYFGQARAPAPPPVPPTPPPV